MSTTIDSGHAKIYQLTKKESTVYNNNQFVVAESGGTGKVVPADADSVSMLGFTTKPVTAGDTDYATASDLPVTVIDGSTHLKIDVESATISQSDELQHFSLNSSGDAINGSSKSTSQKQFQLIKRISDTQGIFICTTLATSAGQSLSNGVVIANSTTNNTFSVDQNGNVGTDVSTDGAIHIENTGNTGIGLGVYTNIGATADAPLVSISAANAAFDQPLVQITSAGATGLGALTIDNNGTSRALYIDHESSSFPAVEVDNSGSSHRAVFIYSNSATTSQALAEFHLDNTSASQNAVKVINDGSADAVAIAQNGDAAHINLSGDPTNSSPADGDLWFDGANLKFHDGTATRTISWT